MSVQRVVACLTFVIVAFSVTVAASQSATTRQSSATAGRCSRAEATAIVKLLGLNDPTVANPVFKVLCGSFTGPGSRTMVVSIWGPGNTGPAEWAVFRRAGGTWQFLMKQPAAASITASGPDIRQTLPIYRPSDPRCCPTGGTKSRLWHWNGSRFVAGPWKQATKGTDAAPAPSGYRHDYFKTPSRNIQCDYGYGGSTRAFVRCGVKSGLKPASRKGTGCYPNVWVVLNATGIAFASGSFCPGEDAPDSGPFSPEGVGQVLAYGKTWGGGGIRCTSAVTGLTCRSKSGHGFFLSRDHWRAF
jgi:hypothetical protein